MPATEAVTAVVLIANGVDKTVSVSPNTNPAVTKLSVGLTCPTYFDLLSAVKLRAALFTVSAWSTLLAVI